MPAHPCLALADCTGTETNRFRDPLDTKPIQGEISATWPDHRYECRLTILKRIVVEDTIVMEDTLERSDQVFSVVSRDAELDGNAIDERVHHLSQDSPYSFDMERDWGADLRLRLNLHVHLDSCPAH